jgi:hypothetical protein
MNRDQHNRRVKALNPGIPQEELDRKWRLLQEQQEYLAALEGLGSGGGGSIPSGLAGPFFELEFAEGAFPVDPYSVSAWNTFFDLPNYGAPFVDVVIEGDTVKLYGGVGITIKASLFDNGNGYYLLSVNDEAQSIVSLEAGAFGAITGPGCPNLSSVYFPAVTDAGDECFKGCGLLSNIRFASLSNLGISCFESSGIISATEVEFPSSNITAIPDNCFSNCQFLTEVSFTTANSIGSSAFNNCTNLTTIGFTNATTLGINCFNNTGLGSVSRSQLPLVTDLPNGAFLTCTYLTFVDLPDLDSIGDLCFNLCTTLISVILPDVKTVGYNAFQNCYLLGEIDLPSATSIGGSCFSGCSGLNTISLPVCVPLGPTPRNDSVFDGIIGNTITLTVPGILATINGGGPDGDIAYLNSFNTLTVDYLP